MRCRRVILPSVVGLVLLASIVAACWVGQAAERELRAILLEQTATAAAAIDAAVPATLSGTEADLANPGYIHLKEMLARFRAVTANIRFVYVVRETGGNVIILCDSEPPESRDYSPPGQAYEEASTEFRAALAARKPAVIGPASDRWGTWVSGLVPLFDKNGRWIAALGCDIDAHHWARAIALRRLTPMLIGLLLIALLVVFHVMYARDRRTLETLRQETMVLDNFFAVSPDLLCVGDAEGRFVRLSQAWNRTLGYTSDELMMKRFMQFVHPDDVPRTREVLAATTSQQEVRGFVNRFRCKDGTYRSLEWCSVAAGGLVYAAARDITDRLKTEEALRKSETWFRSIYEISPIGIEIYDRDGRLIHANPACLQTFGISRFDDIAGFELFKNPNLSEEQREQLRRGEMVRYESAYDFDLVRRLNAYPTSKTGAINLEVIITPLAGEDGTPAGYMGQTRDMTERKQAEMALSRSETFLDNIIEHSPYALWISDDKGNLIRLNQACRDMLHVTDDDIVGKYNLFEDKFIHEQGLLPLVRDLFDHGMTVKFYFEYDSSELRGLPRGASTSRLFDVTISPILDADGHVTNAIVQPLDVTELKRTEAALIQSEAFLNSIIEYSPHAMWISDDQGTLIRLNQACRDLLHITNEQAVGKYNILRDTAVTEYGAMPLVKEVFEKGKTAKFHLEHPNPAQKGLPLASMIVDVTISPVVNAEGRVTNAIVQLLDITERRRVEDALEKSANEMQLIFKNMLNAFVVWESVFDENGKYVSFRFGYFNDAYARISGLKYEDVYGKDVFEVWPTTEKSWVEAYGEVAVTGVPKSFEMYHAPTNGTYHCNAYRPWDSPDRICVIFEDITARKRAEEEQRRLEEQLAQAQKMESIGRLAGGVAHDFNNILAVILGRGELLMEDLPADAPIREDIAEILAAGNRARDLTRQLLAFSRKQVLDIKPIDVNAVIHDIEKMIRRLLGEDIEVKVTTNLNIGYINADPSQFEQALINLCVNARDAMPDGGTLTIATDTVFLDEHYATTHPGVQAGPYVMMSVSDTGMGMDEETQQRIFDPFFTTKETGKGTGLGLSTVYGIVKQHGGTIGVYSEPERGSIFRLYFPCIEKPEAAEALETAEKAVHGNGEVILLMEDDRAVRKLTVGILSHLGYSVLDAGDVEQCLALARNSSRIDLLLTDVIMPGMNGRQVYEQVNGVRPGIKVLFMSGYTDDVIAHHGILDKGVHFISKPFTENALSRKIQEALYS